MTTSTSLRNQTGLLIVDIQQKIFDAVAPDIEFLSSAIKIIKGCQILQLPLLISEQYPQGLGKTVSPIIDLLEKDYQPWIKTTFSALDDAAFSKHLLSLPIQQWIIIGLETHICVLQTAKSLRDLGKEAVVLRDAIASRSFENHSSGLAEMHQEKIRISCVETVLFELLKDAQTSEFKSISQLVKTKP